MTSHTQRMHAPGRLCGWLGALRAMNSFSFSGTPEQGIAFAVMPTAWANPAPPFTVPAPHPPAPPPAPPQPSQVPLLPDAIAQLLAAKRKAGRRPDTLRNLRFYLARFSANHPGITVADITPKLVSDWIDREPSAWSRSSGLFRISSLCSFAYRRGWIAENPCSRVEKMTVDLKPPRILTPGESSALLRAADPKVRPWIVLGLFVGLRPSEALRMDWEAIRLDGERPHVVVDAAASKVRRRRIIALKPAAVAWLALDRRESGPVVSSYTSVRKFLRRAAVSIGMKWVQDICRHTNASYRIASGEHVYAVADELGNSPRILLMHYREICTREAATAFWNLRPA